MATASFDDMCDREVATLIEQWENGQKKTHKLRPVPYLASVELKEVIRINYGSIFRKRLIYQLPISVVVKRMVKRFGLDCIDADVSSYSVNILDDFDTVYWMQIITSKFIAIGVVGSDVVVIAIREMQNNPDKFCIYYDTAERVEQFRGFIFGSYKSH